MGQVYRATDTTLGRQVAIKILPDAFASDPDRLARFEREAKTLASLSHPHIAAIYGFEKSAGVPALVLELVEGEDLSQRIARGPIPIDEALPIAMQIADALEAAHEQGIIHRDLKPANIKVRADGTVKVLDFGLAKAMEPAAGSSPSLSMSPTMTTPAMTQTGMILGTAAYMAPEQARGKTVDRRADIWAFGCVLYEMVSGRHAFAGETLTDTLAAILEREPDWNQLSETTPVSIRRLLRKCLEKDPRRRQRDIGDARMEIDETLSKAVSVGVPEQRAPAGFRLTWLSAAGATALLALGASRSYWVDRTAPPDAVRLSVSTPGQFFRTPPNAVLSPDGRRLVLVASDSSGKNMLWIRALDSEDARVVPGTEHADLPFWSPDSRFVGFFADGALKKVEAAGAPVQVLARVTGAGATWNRDGVILFAPLGKGLAKVSAAGGEVSIVRALDSSRGVNNLAWPHFLPDGQHFLYLAQSEQEEHRGVYVGSLTSNEARLLLKTEFEADYAPPGYVLFARGQTLMAQPFDAKRLALTGEAALVTARLWVARRYGHAVYSAGANGSLAYVDVALENMQLAWFDRGGRPLGPAGPPAIYASPPQLSPDGRRIAVARGPLFAEDLWLLDSVGESSSRFTFDPAGDGVPVWSADGSRMVFQSSRGDGASKLYQKSSSGEGSEELVLDTPRESSSAPGGVGAGANLQDWSSDGRFVVYMIRGKTGHFELWVLPLSDDRKPFPFLQTDSDQTQAQISPNGRWIAYTSNESGQDEVYIQGFPTRGSTRQVSAAGGVQPRWRRDGRELFYLASDQVLMSVPVANEPSISVGRPSALFRTRLDFLGTHAPNYLAGYDATADGQRFLLIVPPEQPTPPITVVLNWTSALKK